jgi:hypothetical protein
MKMFGLNVVKAGIFIFLLPVLLSGQMFSMEDLPVEKMELGFRYLHPDLKGEDGLSLLSGVYDFSIRIPLSSGLNIVGSIPYSVLAGDLVDDSEGCVGNIYVGLQLRLNSRPGNYFFASMGAFLPTAPDNKPDPITSALFTNYLQIQKFFPDMVTIYGNLAYHHLKEGDFIFGGEFGPNLMIPTEEDADVELLVHYALTAGYRWKYVDLKVEFQGLGIITEEELDTEDRYIHDLAFGVYWNRGKIRPGVFYKIYLKEYLRDVVTGVIGLKVDFTL